jgi:hypothetical protein
MSLKIKDRVKQPDSFGSLPQNSTQRSCILGAAQAGPVTQILNLPSGREISELPFTQFVSDIILPQSSFTQTTKSHSDGGAAIHTVKMFDLAIITPKCYFRFYFYSIHKAEKGEFYRCYQTVIYFLSKMLCFFDFLCYNK